MTPLFSYLLSKIRRLLASRAEHKRIRVIKQALRSYAMRREVNINIKTNEYE